MILSDVLVAATDTVRSVTVLQSVTETTMMSISDVQVYTALVIALIPLVLMYRLGTELYK